MKSDGYRHLASAVIAQAYTDASKRLFVGKRDVVTPTGRTETRLEVSGQVAQAIEWLCQESEDLSFWCHVAGIDYRAVVTTARKLFDKQRQQLLALQPKLVYVGRAA